MPAVLAITSIEGISKLESTAGESLLNTLRDNITSFRNVFNNQSTLKNASVKLLCPSDAMSPLLHVCIESKDPMDYEKQTRLLQEVVDEVCLFSFLSFTIANIV
jgi:type VI protein secretion system component Hcp